MDKISTNNNHSVLHIFYNFKPHYSRCNHVMIITNAIYLSQFIYCLPGSKNSNNVIAWDINRDSNSKVVIIIRVPIVHVCTHLADIWYTGNVLIRVFRHLELNRVTSYSRSARNRCTFFEPIPHYLMKFHNRNKVKEVTNH